MKISYKWLKDYLDLDLTPEETGRVLTDIGLEVENIEPFESIRGGLEGLVIGNIIAVEKHPDADRLKVTKVNVGNGGDLQIVCGAPNVAAGQKVLVAPPNTTIYPTGGEPFTIKRSKIRGVESSGMICAEDEVGLGDDHSGIMVLPENVKVGQAAKDYFKVEKDHVFEIGLTPNRADAMSHIGVARDLMAWLRVHKKGNYALKEPETEGLKSSGKRNIPVKVENTEACPRYSGVTITGVQITGSPDWLKNRLLAIGVRPINNVVDITNFVLWEYGQPLHAFDADKIEGDQVIVKTLPEGTKFTTLDEAERTLSNEDLMICNKKGGMCIAGVFGGIGSGVTENTKSIFLESACFSSVWVRRTSQRHNLRTDAAVRFEKGSDPAITMKALKRAARLITELAGGEIASDFIDVYPETIKPWQVEADYNYISKLIGKEIEKEAIKDILKALGIHIIKEENNKLLLEVPTVKVDVKRPADIVEEILRIYGYNNIEFPKHLPLSPVHEEWISEERIYDAVSGYLVNNGFFETRNNSLMNSEYLQLLDVPEERVANIINFSSSDLDILRPSMLISALQTAQFNINRKNKDLKVFELGKTYFKTEKGFDENAWLTLTLTGKKLPESWAVPDVDMDLLYLKAHVLNILNRCGIDDISMEDAEDSLFLYGLSFSKRQSNKALARLGEVNRKYLKAFDIGQPVFFAEINWNLLVKQVKNTGIAFKEINKYPSVRRDLSLLLDKKIKFNEIKNIAFETERKTLLDVNLFDIFEGDQLGSNKKSYAVSFIFQSDKKTLTDKEVDIVMEKLMKSFKSQLNAEIR